MTMHENTLPPQGWYDDGSGQQRWWDGLQWSEYTAPVEYAEPIIQQQAQWGPPFQPGAPFAGASVAPKLAARPISPTAAWLVSGVVGLILLLTLFAGSVSAFLIVLGLAGITVGLFVVLSGRAFWAKLLASRKAGGITAGVALMLVFVGTGIAGATTPPVTRAPVAAPSSSSSPRVTPTPVALALTDVTAGSAKQATASLERSGFRVVYRTAAGDALPKHDDWLVTQQTPAAGEKAEPGSTVILVLVDPTPTPSPTPTPTVAPKPAPAPAPAPAPVKPAPAPAPAPANPAPAPAPAPAAATVVPGAFCPTASQNASGVAANGRTYVCGGKGPDKNGRLHWNTTR